MSQIVKRSELAEVIAHKTMSITDKDGLAKSVAAYLAEHNEQIDLQSLMRDVMQLRLEMGYVEAKVLSAHELNTEVINDIKTLLSQHFPNAKSIKLDFVVDPKIVGGVKIELPRETLDLSVRYKLNLFKRLVAEERN